MSTNSAKDMEKAEELIVRTAALKWSEDPQGFFFFALERMYGIPQKRIAEIVSKIRE